MSFSTSSQGKINLPSVIISTDGSCYPNDGTGSGGWAYVIKDSSGARAMSGEISAPCTNNRAELIAIYEALSSLSSSCRVKLRTDSQYAKNCLTVWHRGWAIRGWRTAGNEPVKNRDLIESILPWLDKHQVTFEYVKGHNGDVENERCDILAAKARKGRS